MLTGALVLLSWIVLEVPEWMANQFYLKDPKDWAAQVTANRTLLVNIIGGLAVGLTIHFTARTYQLTQERLVTVICGCLMSTSAVCIAGMRSFAM